MVSAAFGSGGVQNTLTFTVAILEKIETAKADGGRAVNDMNS